MDPQSNPFAVLSLIVAPAILTNASSVLAMSTSNRLARAVDRARELARQLEDTSHADPSPEEEARESARRLHELSAAEDRAALLMRALQSFYISLGGFAVAVLSSLLGAVISLFRSGYVVGFFELTAVSAGGVAVAALVRGSAGRTLIREPAVGSGLTRTGHLLGTRDSGLAARASSTRGTRAPGTRSGLGPRRSGLTRTGRSGTGHLLGTRASPLGTRDSGLAARGSPAPAFQQPWHSSTLALWHRAPWHPGTLAPGTLAPATCHLRATVTIEQMTFGSAPSDLLEGARNAVGTCLAIHPDERVALVADEASQEVAASLQQALVERQASIDSVLIEAVATRPIREAPGEVLEALEAADAGILCVQPMEGELGARMTIVSVVERRRIRYAHMVGVTPRIMREGMRADYRQVDRLSQQLCDRMQTARMLTVRTASGTNFTATFDPALVWVKTSGIINPRYWSNLPAGEVFTTPASVDGTFVCDGTAGDYFNRKYGSLDRTPLVLEIRGGRLVSAACERGDLERDFWAYCHTDANSDRVGELAFGTNLGLREMIGILLQDEKVPGVHLAFGDPYGSQTHADWSSRTHVDVLTRGCDVWIDEEQVIAEGQYMLEKFSDVVIPPVRPSVPFPKVLM
jgi:aminopeptidase